MWWEPAAQNPAGNTPHGHRRRGSVGERRTRAYCLCFDEHMKVNFPIPKTSSVSLISFSLWTKRGSRIYHVDWKINLRFHQINWWWEEYGVHIKRLHRPDPSFKCHEGPQKNPSQTFSPPVMWLITCTIQLKQPKTFKETRPPPFQVYIVPWK